MFYGGWVIGYTLYERWLKGKKRPDKTGLKDPRRELSIEQILGTCRSVECHSQTQVRSYPQTGNGPKNDFIFAGETKKELSGIPLEGNPEEEFSEQPNIDLVPLKYQPEVEVILNLGEEEEVDSLSVEGKVEYADGVDVEGIMTQLQEGPKRTKKIDELINGRFSELSQAIPQENESDRKSDEETDGFNISDYLPN